jgi:membrane protease YdiL (CAAX protease family)
VRVLIAYLALRTIVRLLMAIHPIAIQGAEPTPPMIIELKLLPLAATLVVTVLAGLLERRRLSEYGLPFGRVTVDRTLQGIGYGFVLFSVIIAALALVRAYTVSGIAVTAQSGLRYGAAWSIAFGVIGLQEELLFRGYLQRTLTDGFGFWPASTVTSALFLLGHWTNPGESAIGLAGVFAIGVLLCVFLRETGSLWFPIGFHAAWDFAESFVCSVPDSGVYFAGHLVNAQLAGPEWLTGGTAGPEGSAITLVLVAAVGVVWVTRSNRFVVRQTRVTS